MGDSLNLSTLVSIVLGVLIILVFAALLFALVRGLQNFRRHGVFGYIRQKIMILFTILPPRKKVWGTIYDSRTKRPIAFAKVKLLDVNNRVLEEHVADSEGRYGFLATPEIFLNRTQRIRIVVTAHGHTFPSRATPTLDGLLYSNLYFGTSLDVNKDLLLSFDIPMDPTHTAASVRTRRAPSIAFGILTALIADIGFFAGVILVPLSFILVPNPFTLGILFLFLGTASLRLWGIIEHPFGVVKDIYTKKAFPFALITLDDTNGKRVAFTVSDERGRYFLLAKKGSYMLTVVTPALVEPMRTVNIPIDSSEGWVTRELIV